MSLADLKTEIARQFGTPAVVVDLDRIERNIARVQAICDKAGVANRPHIKTHKSPLLARMQRDAGARGITCQKLGEAEVMVAAGIDDVLIPYNIVGEDKLERLAARLMAELGLTERFYTIIGGDTLGPGRAKPKPDLLHEMLARAPREGRAAYVGDTTFDTGAARAAAIPCVAVSFGFNDLPPHELGADAVINHFDQLVPVLARL